MAETHELAVMCDTFHPLKLTKLAKALDDGQYAYSWYTEDGVPASYDADPPERPHTSSAASVGVTEDGMRPVGRSSRLDSSSVRLTSVAAIAS